MANLSSVPLFNCATLVNYCGQSPLSAMNVAGVDSPDSYSNSSVDSSQGSPAMPDPRITMSLLQEAYTREMASREPVGRPFLRVVEEPVEKFRFRYKSEMMGTHGSILARSSEKNRRKIYPSVQLVNHNGPAVIRCSLYTAQVDKSQRTPHTHRLIVRAENNTDKDDPHEVIVSQDNNYTAVFHGMGIIHTAKKNVVDELMRKTRVRLLEKLRIKNINISSLSTLHEATVRQEAEEDSRRMNLNSVSLCFEAFFRDANNCIHQICEPVFSKTINNMKSALTGELKICRIDKHVSSCMGGEEVFILVEKVGKKNIKIKFFEVDEDDNEIWHDFGKFSELDVHHQYAIVFRTPPYRDLEIDKSVDVFVQLYRPTDGDRSEPIRFQYKPSEKIGRTRKRHRLSVNDSIPSIPEARTLDPLGIDKSENDPTMAPKADHLLSAEVLPILNEILKEHPAGDQVDSFEFCEFWKNLSVPELNWSQNRSGSLGTENSKAVKTDLDPACSGFVYHSPDNAFNGFVKTEGYVHRDYLRTFDEFENAMELAADGVSEKQDNRTRCAKLPTKEPVEKTDGRRNLKRPAILRKPSSSAKTADDHRRNLPALEDEPVEVKKEPLEDALQILTKAMDDLFYPGASPRRSIESVFRETTEDGDNALHIALLHGETVALKRMLDVLGNGSHTDIINAQNQHMETPLHLAVLKDQPEGVRQLVQLGADRAVANDTGSTALHLAVDNLQGLHLGCLLELLEPPPGPSGPPGPPGPPATDAASQCNHRNHQGFTPLHLAARKHSLLAVRSMVEAGADVNMVDSTYGRTVLHIAVEEECKDIIEFLVKKTNIDVNLSNYAGNTALHVACVVNGSGNLEICQLLLDSKADPFKLNSERRPRVVSVRSMAPGEGEREVEEAPLEVEIKEEVESEDELQLRIDEEEGDDEDEEEDDALQGQNSFDLACNNRAILSLLQRASSHQAPAMATKVRATEEEETVEIKEEPASPPGGNGLLDDGTLKEVCDLLDTSKAWVNLAELMDYGFLVPGIRSASSPSKLLLNYADLHGNVTVQDIRSFLEALDEHSAVEAIDLMLAQRMAGQSGGLL